MDFFDVSEGDSASNICPTVAPLSKLAGRFLFAGCHEYMAANPDSVIRLLRMIT